MMSVTLESGVLKIYGTESADNYQLTMSGSNIVVQRNGVNMGQFPLLAVSRITAVLGAGNDTWNSVAVRTPVSVSGDAGNDTIRTGEGDDTLFGGGGNDHLYGNGGRDLMHGDSGNDYLDGGAGNDTLRGGAGTDTLLGQAGFDWADYRGHASGVRVSLDGKPNDGAPGENDYVGATIEAVLGSEHNDTLIGSAGADILYGMGGNDLLNGAAGNDTLDGGTGNDMVYGGEGNDLLIGGAGGDTLSGAGGIDTVDYRNSPTRVRVTQDNLANDGPNNGAEGDNVWNDVEIIHGSKFNDYIVGGSGNNTIYGEAGNDYLAGGGGNDYVHGGAGHDTVRGDDGNDTLYGGAGDDDLYGGKGNDRLYGDAGNDGMFGGEGVDTLTGGAGLDRFLDNMYVDWNKLAWSRKDTATDLSVVDVRLDFYDTYKTYNTNVSGSSSSTSFDSGKWTDAEVERVDESIGLMQRAAGGNWLILQNGVRQTNLWRMGPRMAGANVPAAGWYAGHVGLYFGNDAFKDVATARRSVLTAFGELAYTRHNMYDSTPWRSFSGWTNKKLQAPATTHTAAEAGWYHLKDAKFVSSAAKTTPVRDFVETWTKAFHTRAGWGHGFSDVPIKEAFVNSLINQMRG